MPPEDFDDPNPPTLESPAPAPLQPEFPPPPTQEVPAQQPGADQPAPGQPTAPDPAYDRTTAAVQEIEKDLGNAVPGQLDDHVRNEIFQTLNDLRKTSKDFDHDLIIINARLQHDGYLPNLFIVDNEQGEQVDPTKLIGPNNQDGFHIDSTITDPVPTGGQIDFSPPEHEELPPEESQSTWHEENPGNPVGSTGAEHNIGGSTPIGDSAVESNPVAMEAMGTPELRSQISEALKILNAQRAAQGLPPIEETPENINAILLIIQHESGGNPNAQNNGDSNAANGDPSRGLMQTIGATFSAHHVPGTSNNIFDPVANIAAGVNYAVNRYGSLQEVPGVQSMASGGAYQPY